MDLEERQAGEDGMSDIKDTLDAVRSAQPKRVDVNERLRRPAVDERALAVLSVCWDALMEVRCERELAEQHALDQPWFLRQYHDSLIVPILVGKERRIVGAMWFKDGLVHLAIKKEFRRGAWTRRLPELFAPGFRAFGDKLFAVVNRRNLVARRFTEKIGGRKVNEDDYAVVYELLKDEMRYWTSNAPLEQTKP